MKPLFTFLFLFATVYLYGQINYSAINHNNASTTLSDGGFYFTDSSNFSGGHEVPQGSGLHTLSFGQFLYAGIDDSGALHISGGGNGAQSDVFNGPYSTTNDYSAPFALRTMWSICQSEIDIYKDWYACNVLGDTTIDCSQVIQPSNEILTKIYAWPAHGDALYGHHFYMAPFFDQNNDGIYDANDGDYPIIKGCCATYLIKNDAAAAHTLTGTQPIGLEIHYMFYQNESNDYMNDVTFVDVMAINRGTNNYQEFAYGMYIDGDIGDATDDFMGSDSSKNLLYFYNSDNNDQNGYGNNPPAAGIVSLANSASVVNDATTGFSTPVEYWNLMNGLNSNGTPITTPSGSTTKYIYEGNPAVSGWTEVASGNVGGERRGIISRIHGAFNSGDTIKETYAILYAKTGDHLENAQKIIQHSGLAKAHFDLGKTELCGIADTSTVSLTQQELIDFNVYPNPNHGTFTIENGNHIDMHIRIVDITGKEIKKQKVYSGEIIELTYPPSGIYMVEIMTGDHRAMKKIVIE